MSASSIYITTDNINKTALIHFILRCMPVVFIHYPYSNPHPPQMGRVWVENNYPWKKWGG
jgi:hypothetical protein